MEYIPFTTPEIQDNVAVKQYMNVINRHPEYFKNKNLDDIIKVRLVIGHQTGDAAKPANMITDVYADFWIPKTQLPPKVILDEMNALTLPPRIVDAF